MIFKEFTLPEIVSKEKNSIKRGPFGGSLKKAFFTKQGYKVYEQRHAIHKDFSSGRYYIDESKFKELKGFSIKPMDVIISCSGTIGKIAEIPVNAEKGIINQALLKLTLDQNIVLNSYFIHLFRSPLIQDKLFGVSHGSGIKNFPPMTVIKSIKFPIPSLSIQKQLVNVIDKADTLRQKDKELLKYYGRLEQSVFLEMFGDPFTNKKDFPVYPLGDLCDELFLGLTSKVDYVNEGGFPLIRATDINTGKLSFEKVKYISEVQHKKLTTRRITKIGDVLISKSGSLGTCAIVDTDKEFSTYESIFTVRPKKELMSNLFLMYLIRNEAFQKKLLGNKVGGTVKHLNLKMFREFEIPLPPVKLQNEFAHIAKNIHQQKNKVNHNIAKSESLFQSLLQKAFKGELFNGQSKNKAALEKLTR